MKQVHNSSPVSEVRSDTRYAVIIRRHTKRLEVDVEATEIPESDMDFKLRIS
jgi:hypothetical protein